MKLDKAAKERLMDNHKERLDATAEAALNVPMIRASVSKHTKKNKGYTQRTEKRTLQTA